MSFDGRLYDIQSTMDSIRDKYANGSIDGRCYEDLFSMLVELRAGYPYWDDDFVNSPNGTYQTLKAFFAHFGTLVQGSRIHPIDLSDDISTITVPDLNNEQENIDPDDVANETYFFDEIDALDLMNDDIGDFDLDDYLIDGL